MPYVECYEQFSWDARGVSRAQRCIWLRGKRSRSCIWLLSLRCSGGDGCSTLLWSGGRDPVIGISVLVFPKRLELLNLSVIYSFAHQGDPLSPASFDCPCMCTIPHGCGFGRFWRVSNRVGSPPLILSWKNGIRPQPSSPSVQANPHVPPDRISCWMRSISL
jgi:hypothetical protein